MGVKLDKFSKEDSFGPVTKFSRTVKTPVPNNEKHSSGNGSEKNRMVVYSIGNYDVKVSKIGDIGWRVKRYEDGELDLLEPGEYYTEEEAHERAREMVEEVAQ